MLPHVLAADIEESPGHGNEGKGWRREEEFSVRKPKAWRVSGREEWALHLAVGEGFISSPQPRCPVSRLDAEGESPRQRDLLAMFLSSTTVPVMVEIGLVAGWPFLQHPNAITAGNRGPAEFVFQLSGDGQKDRLI
jgi:hypothetical protein